MTLKSYYTNVNVDLLNIIPVSARRVVEFGCGAGVLGAAFKQINPSTHYVGVELEDGPSAAARDHLDAVFQLNAESETAIETVRDHLSDLPIPTPTTAASKDTKNSVDALVYGDVIEHLVDPWRTLTAHLTLLREGGTVSLSIPNAQHWSLSLNLVLGRFEYEDQGLRDRTHLRFFTRTSLLGMLKQLGLTVTKLERRKFGDPPPLVKSFSDQLAKAANQAPAPLYDDLTTFQQTFPR